MLLAILAIGLIWNTAAEYLVIPFNNTRPVGPDGPWLPITLGTGAPVQFVDFYPTFNASTSWYVASLNCNNASQSCPESSKSYYDSTAWSGLHNPDLSLMENSSAVAFSAINRPAAQLLGDAGSFGYWHAESFTLAANEGNPNIYFAGGLSQITSNYTNVQFPNGASHVPLSLFTLDPTELYLPKESSKFPAIDGTLLTDLINSSSVASASWSMHIGSFAQGINGSLVIGGYDPNRVIGSPGMYDSSGINLVDISLGSSDGSYNWTDDQRSQNYIGDSAQNVSVTPSAPYLYLPASACSALAKDLPISYNSGYNLYVWDTSNTSYTDIVTSLSYLNFTFMGQNGRNPVSIRIPFALLNLTLEAPLPLSKPISYFPCSPSNSSALGRAFLQAAFIGQNYNSSTFWLGQAPGPSGLEATSNIKLIEPTDTALVSNPTGMTWEQSWSDVLKAVPSGSSPTSSNEESTGPSVLANGAIAGIVVGVVCFVILVIIAIVLWIGRQRRQQPNPVAPSEPVAIDAPSLWSTTRKSNNDRRVFVEAPAFGSASELPARRGLVEVPGDSVATGKQERKEDS